MRYIDTELGEIPALTTLIQPRERGAGAGATKGMGGFGGRVDNLLWI